MNNKTFEYLKHKITKFSDKAHMTLWNDNVKMTVNHRFSCKHSDIQFSMKYIELPSPSSASEMFILATNNDFVMLTTRSPFELNNWWGADPRDLYEQVTGEMPLFQIEWELIEAVPASLTAPLMELFKDYYGAEVNNPTMTIGIVSRLLHKIYNGRVIYLPNTALLGPEWSWVTNMQKARIDGREIPPRPEVLLGERLRHEGLYDGIEWEGAE